MENEFITTKGTGKAYVGTIVTVCAVLSVAFLFFFVYGIKMLLIGTWVECEKMLMTVLLTMASCIMMASLWALIIFILNKYSKLYLTMGKKYLSGIGLLMTDHMKNNGDKIVFYLHYSEVKDLSVHGNWIIISSEAQQYKILSNREVSQRVLSYYNLRSSMGE